MRTTSPLVSNTGFAFIGMLILIVALGAGSVIISMMLVPSLSNRQLKETQDKGKALKTAIALYKAQHGGTTYPGSLTALMTNDNSPATCGLDNTPASPTYQTLQGWCGPYVDAMIAENANDYKTDGWGKPFPYNSGTGAVSSCGPNRSCGDADDISL